MNEYVANFHVHSTYSDGTATIPDIAREAEKAGIDLVFVSDHGRLFGLHDGQEGYHGKVFVLVGVEIGADHNHYLAWRINKDVVDDPDRPQAVIDAVRAQGGIGFLAHPFEKGCKYGYSGKAFTWTDTGVRGYTGICIWNFTSQWKGPVTNPLNAVYYYLYRRGAVRAPDDETMALWDRELTRRKVVAIGGSDAHAFRFGFGPLRPRLFPYRYLFRAINTHILTETPLSGDPVMDRAMLYHAVEKGRCFVAYDLLGDTRGFSFTASGPSSDAVMGEDISLSDGVKLNVKLPRPAVVRVKKDGQTWREGRGAYHVYSVREPGVYRVEVYLRGLLGGTRAWIFSNPVYVRP